jgi:Domain of unknown function (DUF3471)/Domain of unknown function (DUF4440)
MSISTAWAVAGVLAACVLRAEEPVEAPTQALFERLVSERGVATAHGDGAAYSRFVSPHAVFVDDYGVREDGAAHVATIGKRPVGRSRYTTDDVHVDLHDGFAIVDYRAVEHVLFGPREVDTSYRIVETYVPHDGRWVVLSHSEAQIAADAPPQPVPSRTLEDYVGRYEWWPGYVDTITRDGDTLYSQGTGDPAKILNIAATPESFYLAGEPNLVVFARDRSGRVTHYVLHWSDGKVTVARRVG